jgi:hypothetical protein
MGRWGTPAEFGIGNRNRGIGSFNPQKIHVWLAFLFRSLWRQKAEEGEGEKVLCVFSSIKTKRNPVVKIST